MDKTDLSIIVDRINALTANQKAISGQANGLAEYVQVLYTCLKETQDVLLDYNLRLAALEAHHAEKETHQPVASTKEESEE